ncbi:hypothetical protein I302_105923 [Kwoniella bestiolae CBS 10118]|uniref:Uncharacterized protein n=1 Tax=Kwoniella bestiolae CBS 10118 TaxID=1296100 RepID=A0A1B9G2I6_9TREE|nr:hypothetical protein I302_05047 [Kwoniella bestiolae CBS 10118]OCF25234.1 hypothetical protein I302_05047 [Kwoniella bestiolae CBS 10118]
MSDEDQDQPSNLFSKLRASESSAPDDETNSQSAGLIQSSTSQCTIVRTVIPLSPGLEGIRDISFDESQSSECLSIGTSSSKCTSSDATEKDIRPPKKWKIKIDSWRPLKTEDAQSQFPSMSFSGRGREQQNINISQDTVPSHASRAYTANRGLPPHSAQGKDKGKTAYILNWKRSITPYKEPHANLEERVKELEEEIVDLKHQIEFQDRYADLLISSPSYTQTIRSLSRLCGLFPPSTQLFSAPAEVSRVTGSRRPYEWVHNPLLMDEAISRCVRVLMRIYDDTTPLSLDEEDVGCMERLVPPDVLWVLVQTCDTLILHSLERVLEIALKSAKRLTQRWGVICVLLGNIRCATTYRRRSKSDFREWARKQSLLFARNFWVLDHPLDQTAKTRPHLQYCNNLDAALFRRGASQGQGPGGITRISIEEIRGMIREEIVRRLYGDDQNIRGKKRKITSYEDLYAMDEDGRWAKDDGVMELGEVKSKRVRR